MPLRAGAIAAPPPAAPRPAPAPPRAAPPRAAAGAATAAAASTMRGRAAAIVWFRAGDLRLADHAPLAAALAAVPAADVVPLFVLDDRELQGAPGRTPPAGLGLPSAGPHRARATLQAAAGLRTALRARGSELLCCAGAAPAAVGALAAALRENGAAAVSLQFYAQPGPAAAALERGVEAAAAAAGIEDVGRFWGHTLFHPDDLLLVWPEVAPPPAAAGGRRYNGGGGWLAGAPLATQTGFRRPLMAGPPPRRPLPAPAALPPPPPAARAAALERPLDPATADVAALYAAAGAGEALRRLEELTGLRGPYPGAAAPPHPCAALRAPTSEAAAAARLEHLLHGGGGDTPPPIHNYGESRFTAVGEDSSAKLGAALALGCLSPRTAYWAVLEAMLRAKDPALSAAGAAAAAAAWRWADPSPVSPGHAHLLMHLGIRDYFAFRALAAPEAFDEGNGGDPAARGEGPSAPAPAEEPSSVETESFAAEPAAGTLGLATLAAWARGRTGLPFVDAGARELAATGYASNRSRQNAASLLVHTLGGDWRAGAEVFQALLTDADWAANSGNWSYIAWSGGAPGGRGGAAPARAPGGTGAERRAFKVVTQGERYDPGAALALAWLPELAAAFPDHPAARHRPWAAGGTAGYPAPAVDPARLIGAGARRRRGGGTGGSGQA
jgi:deoxyribodipyrimidine photo-lyase